MSYIVKIFFLLPELFVNPHTAVLDGLISVLFSEVHLEPFQFENSVVNQSSSMLQNVNLVSKSTKSI